MALRISLDSDQTLYLSGDVVEGRVQYESLTARSVGRIEIKFWGRLKSTIVEKNPLTGIYNQYRDRVCLFEESQSLLSDDTTVLDPGKHDWPFSFTFPTSAAPRKLEQWGAGPTITQFPEQVLPPSLHLNARTKGLVSGHYSIVSYALVASIQFKDDGPQEKDASLLLNFIPASSHAPPESEHQDQTTHEARGFDLLPEPARPQPTSRSLASLAKKPTLRLRITTSHPVCLSPTEPWKLCVKLDVLPARPNDVPVPTPPPFLLRSVDARVKCKTAVAITRTVEHSRSHGATAAELKLFNLGAVVPGEEKEVGMGKLGYIPATVNLSSVSRQYRMRVDAVVETADRAHVFKVKSDAPVIVEPLPMQARNDAQAMEMVRAGVAEAVLEDVGTVLEVGLGILGLVTS
ncbi:hypothetical protein SLS56_004471 [Neofusicoccum ribis]|uniref:Arrestin-like N-terminal domain-containing protein n=1 Tax=Neofusicoccum ribis TaxID=45134 RepID=A0ABR3SXB2_9PEZI